MVVDGSRDAVNRAATRSAVTEVPRPIGQHFEYVGIDEAAALAARLAAYNPPRPGLLPGPTGANRSIALLMTAGEDVLCLDDDILCDTWARPDWSDDLVVMGHDERRYVAFHADRAAALADAPRVSRDLLRAHERLLGRTLPELVLESPADADLSDACEHVWSRLRSARPPVVRATFSGLAGDSATSSPSGLLLSSGTFVEQLWSDPAAFATAMSSREVTRIAASNLVTHKCHCMSACMGLSNRTVTPPFPWLARGEDGVFGVLVSASDPAALFAHVPVGVVHDSTRPPAYETDWRRSNGRFGIFEVLIAFIVECMPSLTASLPPARLREIGTALTTMASSSPTEFVAKVTSSMRESRLGQFEFSRQRATVEGCPEYWRTALREYRDACVQAMTRPEFFLPVEYSNASSLETGFADLQRFVLQFGEFVTCWPDLWETARELNPAGRE